MKRYVVFILRILPQNFISFLVGALTRIPWPAVLGRPIKRWFVQTFRIDMTEAERPLEDYHTLEDVFTRRLKRPITYPGGLCSPCDGVLSIGSRLREQDGAIQAKGFTYSAWELIRGGFYPEPSTTDTSSTTRPDLCAFFTIYLAPHNYHRVHVPVTGHLLSVQHIPGELWPVNETFVQWIPRIFTRNERIVCEIAPEGGGRLWVVMVGAFNVGRIRMDVPGITLTSNLFFEEGMGFRGTYTAMTPPVQVHQGDPLGTFMLGSTVVVVADTQATSGLSMPYTMTPILVKLGDTLGTQHLTPAL